MASTLATTSSTSSLDSITIQPLSSGQGVPIHGQTAASHLPIASSSHMHPMSTNAVSMCRGHLQFDDIIEEIESNSGSSGPSPVDMGETAEVPEYPSMEPIIIRGSGNMTLFGLSNTFNCEFPSVLIGRVSREEFEASLARINELLRQHYSTNTKLLLLGCLCCCCSLGCSLLWPSLALSKRTRTALEKLIANENQRLYHRLGLNWKLSKERCHTNYAFVEYVLVIEFLPKLYLNQPD